jgi:class 3 adenylate cyclase
MLTIPPWATVAAPADIVGFDTLAPHRHRRFWISYDRYGNAVNIASRICGLSAPGEILVSATIRDLARTSAAVTFEDRGDHPLKGIDDPVRIYAVLAG